MQELCSVTELEPVKFRIIELGQRQSIIVIKHGKRVLAYHNQCPHANVRLDMDRDNIIALDGYHLFCSLHGALFNPDNGHCVAGPCKGMHLTALPIEVRDDKVWLTENQPLNHDF